LGTLDIQALLDSVWKLLSGTLTKLWGAISPSLEKLWDKIDPWLKDHGVNLDGAIELLKDMVALGKEALGPGGMGKVWDAVGEFLRKTWSNVDGWLKEHGVNLDEAIAFLNTAIETAKHAFDPGGLVDGVVTQAKFFLQDASKFVFDALAKGLALAYLVQKTITQALIDVTSMIFGMIDVLDEHLFVPILKLIRDVIIPIGDALFALIKGIDQKILLPFRQAATLIIPAIKLMAQPANPLAEWDFANAVKDAMEVKPFISEDMVNAFDTEDLKTSLTKSIDDLPERMAGRSKTEYKIESAMANVSGDIQTLINTLEAKAIGIQQSLDTFLEVKDTKGNVVTKESPEGQAMISGLKTAVENLTAAMNTTKPQQPGYITIRIVDSTGSTAKQFQALSGTNMTIIT
jgi:hypothetical protein